MKSIAHTEEESIESVIIKAPLGGYVKPSTHHEGLQTAYCIKNL